MANATAQPLERRAYDELISHLSEHDIVAVPDLPKALQELRVLAAAWTEGMIEFGRRTLVLTGIPGTKSERIGTQGVLEDSWSWTGLRKSSHMLLRDLLNEKPMPEGLQDVQKIVRTMDKDGEKVEKVMVPLPEAEKALRLHVRLTDKGYGRLAA